jgi:hypothetical protein
VDPHPDVVPRDVGEDLPEARLARLAVAVVHHRAPLLGVAGIEQTEADERQGPDPLELGPRPLGDVDRLAGLGQTADVIHLERVQAGQAHVGQRELRGGTRPLQCVASGFELAAREVRLRGLPLAAAQDDPEPGCVQALAEALEILDALAQVPGGGRRRAVEPMIAPDPAHGQRPLLRVVNVRQDPLEQRDRLPERDGPLGVRRAFQAHGHRLIHPTGSEEVVRQVHGGRSLPLGEDVGRPRVNGLAARRHDVGVDRLLGQRMTPAVAPRLLRVLLEKLLGNRLGQRRVHGLLGGSRDGHEDRIVERPPERGRGLERADVLGRQARDPKQDGVAYRLRDCRVADPERRGPVGRRGGAALGGLLHHLLEDERVALGALQHQLPQLGVDVVGTENGLKHLGDPPLRQRPELDQLGEPRAPPAPEHRHDGVTTVKLVAAVGDQDQGAKPGQPPRDVVEELASRGIGPVNVLDHEEHPVIPRGDRKQGDDRLEQAQLRLLGVAGLLRAGAVGQLREELREVAGRGAEPRRDRARVLAVEVLTNRLDEGQVRQRQLGLAAGSPQHLVPQLPREAGDLVRESRLPDARLAREDGEAALAAMRRDERGLEGRELVVPLDENRTQRAGHYSKGKPRGADPSARSTASARPGGAPPPRSGGPRRRPSRSRRSPARRWASGSWRAA